MTADQRLLCVMLAAMAVPFIWGASAAMGWR